MVSRTWQYTFRPSVACVSIFVVAVTACGASQSRPPTGSATQRSKTTYGSEEFGLSLAALSAKVEKAEAAIGACMHAAGLAYVPLDFSSFKGAMDSDKSKPGLSDAEYAKQFGLGITTQPDSPIAVFAAGRENKRIYDTLPAASQAAYRRTLWGENVDWTLVRAIENEDLTGTGGCTRTAADATFSPSELKAAYVNPADQLIESDKRMVKAMQNWSACMKKVGFPYSRPDEVNIDLTARLKALRQGRPATELIGSEKQALTELQGEERAIAVAAKSCEDKHIADVQAQVESEVFANRPA